MHALPCSITSFCLVLVSGYKTAVSFLLDWNIIVLGTPKDLDLQLIDQFPLPVNTFKM